MSFLAQNELENKSSMVFHYKAVTTMHDIPKPVIGYGTTTMIKQKAVFCSNQRLNFQVCNNLLLIDACFC
jgi:hypothetical protein